jgi:ABC-type nickel/cobalt efflux system permease component RcnA
MSRNTILQMIAALITIAILVFIRQGLDWSLRALDPKFMMGLVTGAAGMVIIVLLAFWYDHRKSAALRRRQQQSTRDVVDF